MIGRGARATKRFEERQARLASEKKSKPEKTIYLTNTDVGIIAVGALSVSEKVAKVHPQNTYATKHNSMFKRQDGAFVRFFDTEEEAFAQLRDKLEAQEKFAEDDLERAKRRLARARARVARLNAGEEVRVFDAMQKNGPRKLSEIDGGFMGNEKGPFVKFDESTEGYDGEDESLQEDSDG